MTTLSHAPASSRPVPNPKKSLITKLNMGTGMVLGIIFYQQGGVNVLQLLGLILYQDSSGVSEQFVGVTVFQNGDNVAQGAGIILLQKANRFAEQHTGITFARVSKEHIKHWSSICLLDVLREN